MAVNSWLVLMLTGGLAAQGTLELPKPMDDTRLRERQAPSSDPGAPLAAVALGGYSQSVNNHNGIWQGLLLDGSWDPWRNGKFVASLVTSDRPAGSGTVISLGKYQEFRGGYAFLGLATSRGADYLPTAQVIADLNVDLPMPGLVLGGGCVYTRVRDQHENIQVSFGPTLYAGDFISTLRWSTNRSNPGRRDSTATSAQIRHGAQDHRAWQSLRVSWGGEAYQNLVVHESVEARGIGVSLDLYFPMGREWTLQTGLEWGQKNAAYHLWGGSIRLGRTFH